jgi:hypothetical protein
MKLTHEQRQTLCEKYKHLDISHLSLMQQLLYEDYICGFASQKEISVTLNKSQQVINYQCKKLVSDLEKLYTQMNDSFVTRD